MNRRLAVVLLLLGGAVSATADVPILTFDVDSRLDNPDIVLDGNCADINGKCTLRAAVQEASVAEQSVLIRLPGGPPYVLSQQGLPDNGTHGDLDVGGKHNIEILGDGASVTIIDANHIDRLFYVDGYLTLTAVTLRNGKPSTASHSGGGGAIYLTHAGIYGGTLKLNACIVESNDSTGSGDGGAIEITDSTGVELDDTTLRMNTSGGLGGAIDASGADVTLRRCTLNQNAATWGGGFYQYEGTARIENTTFYGNTALRSGGGVYVTGLLAATKLNNVTLALNAADFDEDGLGSGGGIGAYGDSVLLSNCILENVNDFTRDFDDCVGTLSSGGYNIFSTTAGCTIPFGNYTVGDSLGGVLAVLGNNGGLTQTVLPVSSNAIDQGDVYGCHDADGVLLPTDQRGAHRQIGTYCDLGAVEVEPKGDANGDGVVNVADVFYLINYLFAGGPIPLGRANVNGGSVIDVADVFYLINYLFAGGPAPV